MARKKTFVTDAQLQENPALTFISQESVDAVEGRAQPEPIEEPAPEPKSAEMQAEPAAEQPLSRALPAMPKPPQGFKRNPEFIEVKSKRIQLVMQPSLYQRVKAASEAEGVSFNEYCHRVLDMFTAQERAE